MRILTGLSIPFLLSGLFAADAGAQVLYVSAWLTTGANDGSSWDNAFRGSGGLTAALAAATPQTQQIWVAGGVYLPTQGGSRTASFLLRNGLEIYGGFAGDEASLGQRPPPGTVTSTLCGDLNGDDVSGPTGENSLHVVDAQSVDASAVLDGFVVTAGNANLAYPHDRGAGLLCLNSASPTIRNTRFLGNVSMGSGGAVHVSGGTGNPTFVHCTFEQCGSALSGGAIALVAANAATIDRCAFIDNVAPRGGAVDVVSATGPVRFLNSVMYLNTAYGAGAHGGAVLVGDSNVEITNCTITRNDSIQGSVGGISVSGPAALVRNCIVWNNLGQGLAMGAANQVTGGNVSHSIVTAWVGGLGNSSADPQFVDWLSFDLRLSAASPAIDAGNSNALPAGASLDFDGHPRIVDDPAVVDTGIGSPSVVDIGAYEWPVPSIELFCFGDGSGTPCPCGNNSAVASNDGCLNSLGQGGRLRASGTARIGGDSLLLSGSQMSNSVALYLQGTVQANSGGGSPLGDGLRCAAGQTIRLGTRPNVGGASQFPSPGDPSISVRGQVSLPGTVRHYQAWYRNGASFCQPATFNLTNGVSVRWEL